MATTSNIVTMRLDPAMRAELEAAAARNGISVSEMIRRAVADYLGSDEGRSKDVEHARKILRCLLVQVEHVIRTPSLIILHG